MCVLKEKGEREKIASIAMDLDQDMAITPQSIPGEWHLSPREDGESKGRTTWVMGDGAVPRTGKKHFEPG